MSMKMCKCIDANTDLFIGIQVTSLFTVFTSFTAMTDMTFHRYDNMPSEN